MENTTVGNNQLITEPTSVSTEITIQDFTGKQVTSIALMRRNTPTVLVPVAYTAPVYLKVHSQLSYIIFITFGILYIQLTRIYTSIFGKENR